MRHNLVEKVFRNINRADFVLPAYRNQADLDIPLPIGYGQTISQPTTVRLMLGWLKPAPGDKVLDIGSGSGWTTALLSNLVGGKGMVYAVERISELVEFGRNNCRKAGIKNIEFYQAGHILGLPEHAPYNKILVSAAAGKFPQELLLQLNPGGKIVIPVANSVYEINKNKNGKVTEIEHFGFVFVPLIMPNDHDRE